MAVPCRDTWPRAYWDDWMRLAEVRKGRQCIRPEVSRTYNFGVKGSYFNSQYSRSFLAHTRLNSDDVNWAGIDVSYLKPKRWGKHLSLCLFLHALIAIKQPKAKSVGVHMHGCEPLLDSACLELETS